ncbi:MAG: hypothetical protein OEW83_06355 [Acidimicrobiia bacterium]|nr:hypothetical protein [Acidimicrobiia bacterium]
MSSASTLDDFLRKRDVMDTPNGAVPSWCFSATSSPTSTTARLDHADCGAAEICHILNR